MSALLFAPPPPPKTALGRYRNLAPRAGIAVSPFCLGGMSIGDKWSDFGFGAMDKVSETSRQWIPWLIRVFRHAGLELQAPRRLLRRWRQFHRHCQQLVRACHRWSSFRVEFTVYAAKMARQSRSSANGQRPAASAINSLSPQRLAAKDCTEPATSSDQPSP
jgi:hypothetical protein